MSKRKTKVISISVDPWVYEEILKKKAAESNLSSWMQELAIKAHYESKINWSDHDSKEKSLNKTQNKAYRCKNNNNGPIALPGDFFSTFNNHSLAIV